MFIFFDLPKSETKSYKMYQYSSVRYTTLASGDFALVFSGLFKTRTFTPAGMTTSFRTALHSNSTFFAGSFN